MESHLPGYLSKAILYEQKQDQFCTLQNHLSDCLPVCLGEELEDRTRIATSIERDVSFRGTNLWVLIAAIVIASVGLNVNSTAVIIGAMLISPLMGPIIGVGFSLATYNLPLLKKSLRNFSVAVFVSIATSAMYFSISPLREAGSALQARTSPTTWDVVIAFFGGLAGIIAAIGREKKITVVSGVAIATALMPPLCTVGYGLARLEPQFFLGAFSLFLINAVFISNSDLPHHLYFTVSRSLFTE